MIKGIYIENFKGIGEPGIKLDLEPVTLLFGSNSAGKSTIFHAFLYAYEVLVNRNLNVDRTTLGGNTIDLGGFHAFVHDHHPANKIRIKIDLDLSSAKLDQEWRIAESLIGTGENEVDLSTLGTDVWSASIGFAVSWDEVRKSPFVSEFSVALDEIWLLAIWCDKYGDAVNSNTNYRHPIFRWPNAEGPAEQGSAGVLDSLYRPFRSITDQWFWADATEFESDIFDEEADLGIGNVRLLESPNWRDLRMIEHVGAIGTARWFYRYDTEQQKAILEAGMFYAGSEWSQAAAAIEWAKLKSMNDNDTFISIDVLDQHDALPRFDRPLQLLIAPAVEAESRELIRNIVSRLALGPAKLLVNQLTQFRHIGPLREIPPRTFRRILSPDPSRWCSGLAAWDVLSAASDEFIAKVSEWLSSDHRLGTGYTLVRKSFKELESDGYIIRILQQENPLDDLPIALDGLAKLPEQTRLILRDENSTVEIDPPDIAVGITQLVPVVVSAMDEHEGITLIEQPELHNHPAVEVGLGDLFVQTIRQKHCRFILETHGEHLILRILKRIRQTSDNELPEGVKGLLPDEVAVYHIERTADGVKAKRLRIDDTGEFIDKWPNGFFRERAEELF